MKVYVLNNGWLEYDGNFMMSWSSLTMQRVRGWQSTWTKIPVYAILIDHPAGKIVYDLSCDPNSMRESWQFGMVPYYRIESQCFWEQLAWTGTKPQDVNIVILSHFQSEAESNLWAFRHADFYIQQEVRAGKKQPDSLGDDSADGLKKEGEPKIKTGYLHAELELIPGVQMVNVYHYGIGLFGIMLHLQKQGTLLFLQDVIYFRRYYNPPGKSLGTVYETWMLFDLIRRVQHFAKQRNARPMFYDSVNFPIEIEIAPQLYE